MDGKELENALNVKNSLLLCRVVWAGGQFVSNTSCLSLSWSLSLAKNKTVTYPQQQRSLWRHLFLEAHT